MKDLFKHILGVFNGVWLRLLKEVALFQKHFTCSGEGQIQMECLQNRDLVLVFISGLHAPKKYLQSVVYVCGGVEIQIVNLRPFYILPSALFVLCRDSIVLGSYETSQ